MNKYLAFCAILFLPVLLLADSLDLVPGVYKGRIRPLIAIPFNEGLSHLFYVPEEDSHSLSLNQRLLNSSSFLKVLPGKSGEWFPLAALNIPLAPNFTLYEDTEFLEIKNAYQALLKEASQEKREYLGSLLLKNYQKTLEGKAYLKTAKGSLFYPTHLQLKAEAFYVRFPFAQSVTLAYLLTLLFLLLSFAFKSFWINRLGYLSFLIGFTIHTSMLFLRIWILQRPPVSNMFETVIYVPWIASLLALFFTFYFKEKLFLIFASFLGVILLAILELTHLDNGLENVQAVLNSNFWLTIHVLMIVASYGVLILGGLLGHFYLLYPKSKLGAYLLQLLYIGVALLIPGTLLGGVWAAESWGRFWDWDPKESWAFISSCIYLLFIHAFRFHKIGYFGLAVGSIIGLMAISFTWYGVNYILGTGLHSYGFGSGGEGYYFLFLLAELLFLAFCFKQHKQSQIDGKGRLKNPTTFPK